jgi:hypothetical protein
MPYFGNKLLNPSICVAIKPPQQLYINITVSANSNENTAFGTVGGSEHTIILQREEWDIN